MNLVREYLGTIDGVHIFGILAMIIFLAVFVFVIYHTLRLRKDDVKEYKQLPLEEDENDQDEI
jgi:cbb3-type cytochrome oxidase subunit 3